MHNKTRGRARLVGALLLVVAAAVVARWLLPWDRVASLVPGTREIGLAGPLLFAALGICFLAEAGTRPASVRMRRAAALAGALLVLVPLAYLVEAVAAIDLGIDIGSPGVTATALRPYPGRLSPNACVAFMLSGLAFWLLRRPPSRAAMVGYLAALVGVGSIGLAGLAGHFLGLEALYKIAGYNRLLPITAVGFVVTAGGLWALHEARLPFDLRGAAHRIQRRMLAVVVLLTLTAGVAGFATMRDTFEESLARDMLLTATATATSLAHSVEVGLWYPRTLATRPTVRQGLQRLNANPADDAARASLQNIADSFRSADLSAAEFQDAAGRRVAQLGEMMRERAPVVHALRSPGQNAVLVWDRGYILAADQAVRVDGVVVGHLRTEQRLRLFDQLLEQVRTAGATSDAAVCSHEGDHALCAPTRFRQPAFTLPLSGIEGQAGEAIGRALRGESGVLYARDPRNVQVLAAYAPLKDFGLALGVKSDIDTLYAPLRPRLALLAAALLLIVALAVYALRDLVVPVLQRLADSEQRAQAILEGQTELVSLARTDGTLTYVNPSYARFFGHAPAAMVGISLYDTVAAEDRPAVHAALETLLRTGTAQLSENRNVDAAGVVRWVAWTNTLQRGLDGELQLHAVGRDVTERRVAEEALRANQRALSELTTIFDRTTDFVVQTDRRGAITYLNPAARRILGLAAEAPLAGLMFADFNTPETNALLAETVIPAVAAEGIWIGETDFRGAAGQLVPVSHMVIGHRDESGRVTRYSGIMRDISAALAAKREQQRHAATLRSITEAIPAIVAVVGADGRYRFVNSSFERWCGRPREEIVGQSVAAVVGPADYERSRAWMERALAGELVSFEREYAEGGLARHLAVSYVPLYTDAGAVDGFVGVAQDITVHRQEEVRLLQMSQRDALTGLLNRAGFEHFLDAIAASGSAGLGLLYVDLDHFKPVNDAHGHAVGDQLLQQFALRLRSIVRPTDGVARLGGDEFAVALVGVREAAHVQAVAEKIVAAAQAPFVLGALRLQVGASVGIAGGGGDDPRGWRELLQHADARLYVAKGSGRGRHA